MAAHLVRRLPLIDGHDLVGLLSQADLAKACRTCVDACNAPT